MPGRQKKNDFFGKLKYCVGLKEKSFWAKENGTRVEILPFLNQKNWEEIGIFS
jgi:ATP-dependent Lon protease